MAGNHEFQRRLESIEDFVHKIETAADPSLRATARELGESLMELHGASLERTLEIIRAAGAAGDGILERLGRDPMVASLLVLYGLHPQTLETRVAEAVEKVRPRLQKRGGGIQLLSVQNGEVRVKLEAEGKGCGSTAEALKPLVEEALYDAAPDIATLVVEGAAQPGFVSVDQLLGAHASNGHFSTVGGKGRL